MAESEVRSGGRDRGWGVLEKWQPGSPQIKGGLGEGGSRLGGLGVHPKDHRAPSAPPLDRAADPQPSNSPKRAKEPD